MTKTFFLILLAFLGGGLPVRGKTDKGSDNSGKITVAVYYFPNYHTNDARNIKNKGEEVKGAGCWVLGPG